MFGLEKTSTRKADLQRVENSLRKEFAQQFRSMFKLISAATGKTVTEIREAIAALVEKANGRVEEAQITVNELRMALRTAETELNEAIAERDEALDVEADMADMLEG